MAASGFAAAALCVPVKDVYAGSRRPLQYCVVTPAMDDLTGGAYRSMDVSWAKPTITRTLPNIAEEYKSVLTLSDETGEKVRRAFVPGLLHNAVIEGDRAFVVTRGNPALFYSVNLLSLEIEAHTAAPEGMLFGGHVIPWVEPDHFAVTLNRQEEGAYDRIGIYRGRDMKKVDEFSSHGFQAHELAFTPDKKQLIIGHYGSNYFSGPYTALNKPKKEGEKRPFYPGSVVTLDMADKRFVSRASSTVNGPQGHIAASSHGHIFLPRLKPLLIARPDSMNHPSFLEGKENKLHGAEFSAKPASYGGATTVVVDEKYQQFLVPYAWEPKLIYGSTLHPRDEKNIPTPPLGDFGKPYGLAMHINGEDFIVSCGNGFMAFKRGTQEFMKEKSFVLPLGVHSHFCLG